MYVECQFITRPYDVGNHFNIFFINKVDSLRAGTQLHVNLTCNIVNSIMRDKTFCFAFDKVNQDTVEQMLLSLSDDLMV